MSWALALREVSSTIQPICWHRQMALFAAAYTSELKGLREPQLSDQWRAPNSLAICVVSKVSGNFVSGVHIDWFDSLDNYWRTDHNLLDGLPGFVSISSGVGTLYGRRRNDLWIAMWIYWARIERSPVAWAGSWSCSLACTTALIYAIYLGHRTEFKSPLHTILTVHIDGHR